MFKRIELPYEYDALEPHIDKETVKVHYEKHHKGYETKLNESIKDKENEISNFKDLDELMKNYVQVKDIELKFAVRQYGGGLINHNFYWKLLSPNGGKIVEGNLKKEIEKKWGSIDDFIKIFTEEAMKIFGSGWAWLVLDRNSELKIIRTFNQDNPWFSKSKPIIGIDVWEHAYYLKHHSNRAKHIEDFWKIINWEFCEKQFNDK